MAVHANSKKNLKPGLGRAKGSKNKIPRDIKDRVLQVWAKLEAEKKGLYEEAAQKPAWFYENFLKPMLPKNVDIGSDGPIILKVVYETAGKDKPKS